MSYFNKITKYGPRVQIKGLDRVYQKRFYTNKEYNQLPIWQQINYGERTIKVVMI